MRASTLHCTGAVLTIANEIALVLQEQYLHEEPAYYVFNVKLFKFYRHKAKYNHKCPMNLG